MADKELFDGTERTTIEDAENIAFRSPSQEGSRVISWLNFKNILASTFVGLAGDQNIDGIKTFLKSPVVPDPSTDLQAVNLRTLNSKTSDPEYIDFVAQSTPPDHKTGRLYFDSVQDALTYYNSVSGISMQIGLELWVRCYNNSGSIINDGIPVYISGADITTELPNINVADSNYYAKSRVIGLSTHSIGINSIGYVAFFGVVNDYDAVDFSIGDIIYLGSNGAVQNTVPANGEFPTRIGTILKDGLLGKLQLNISTSQYTAETLEQNGFPDTDNLSVTFDDLSYTLTVAPVDGIRVRYYGRGIKYFSEGTGDTFQIADVSGLHLIYYDNGVLTEIIDPTLSQQVSILVNYAAVTSIYWRAVDRQIYFGNQTHCSIGYGSRQIGLDQIKYGAQYVPGSGLGLDDFVIGSGSLDSHAQFSIASGQISNSDLLITTPAFASTVGVEVAYVDTTGIWERATNAGFSFLNTGTGRVAYQDPVLGGLVEVSDGNYVLYHIIATNDFTSGKRVFAIPGLAEHTSVANAEAAANDEAATILESAPINELVIVGIDIIQTKDSYSNSAKARIVQTTDGENYIDTRTSGVNGGGGYTPQTTFSDSEYLLFNAVDVSKEGAFSNADIPTSTKRIINFEYLYQISLGRIFNAAKTQYTSLVSLATTIRTATFQNKDTLIADLYDGIDTQYLFNDSVAAGNPGSSYISFDNETLSEASFAYISHTQRTAGNIGSIIQNLAVGSTIIVGKHDRTNIWTFTLSSLEHLSGYSKLGLTNITIGTSFTLNDIIGVGLYQKGKDTYSDADFEVYNEADNTKKLKIDASNISTDTTATATFPGKDITVAGLEDMPDKYLINTETELIAKLSTPINRTLVINANITLTASRTVSNAHIEFASEKTIDGAFTLTLQSCSIENKDLRLFGDDITVLFTKQSGNANPCWWGAKGDNDQANKTINASAFVKASESINTLSGLVKIPTGIFVSSPIDLSHLTGHARNWSGSGDFGTIIKLAIGENSYLLNAPWGQKDNFTNIQFDGDNATWNATQASGNNPGTEFLVKIGGWGSKIDCHVRSSGGHGLVMYRTQAITLFRPICNYNWGYGIVIESNYGTYVYSPWCEYNYLGGILITHTYLAADVQRNRIRAGNYVIGGSYEGCGKYGSTWQYDNPDIDEVAAVELSGVEYCHIESATEQVPPLIVKTTINSASDLGYRASKNNTIVARNNTTDSNILLKSGCYSNMIVNESKKTIIIDEDETNFLQNGAEISNSGIVSKEYFSNTSLVTSSYLTNVKNQFAPSSAKIHSSRVKTNILNGANITQTLSQGYYYFRIIYKNKETLQLRIQDATDAYHTYNFSTKAFDDGGGFLFPRSKDFRYDIVKFYIPAARTGHSFRFRLDFKNYGIEGDIEIAYTSVVKEKNAALQFLYGNHKGIGNAGTGISTDHEKAYNAGIGNVVYLSNNKARLISDGYDWYDTAGVISDTQAPELVEAFATDTTQVLVRFDKKLTGTPVNGDFAITLDAVAATITGYTITNNEILFTITETILDTDAILFSYTKPGSNQLVATPNGVDLASIVDSEVLNSL